MQNVIQGENEEISPILNGIHSQLTNLEMDTVDMPGNMENQQQI